VSVLDGQQWEVMHARKKISDLMRRPAGYQGGVPYVSPGEHYDAGTHIHKTGGAYEWDEVRQYEDVAKGGAQRVRDFGYGDDDEEVDRFLDAHALPTQGMLFHPSDTPTPDRVAAANEHSVHFAPTNDFLASPEGARQDDARREVSYSVRGAMHNSRMPTELISALKGRTTTTDYIKGAGGFYAPDTGEVWARSFYRPGETDGLPTRVDDATILHELGHRADFRSQGFEGPKGFRRPRLVDSGPEPQFEGVADGLADRWSSYPPASGQYRRFQTTGYSTTPDRHWDDTGRAVYAAARAHAQETGENPPAGKGADEYLHRMMMTSTPAVRALRQTGLKDVGAAAVDRYKETRRVGTQLSMIGAFQTRDTSTGKVLDERMALNPSLTGVGIHNAPEDQKPPPGGPGTSRGYASMDQPVYDIPEDHKPQRKV
jgi:hypothetical protein